MRLSDLAAFNSERAARRPVALVTDIESNAQRVVTMDNVANDPLGQEIAARLRLGRSGLIPQDGREFFVTVRMATVRLIVVGAVHISQALATMARLADLDVTIVDPRRAYATPVRFPDVTLITELPDDILRHLGLDAHTAVAVLTHDPKIDDPALCSALRAECFYVGALGSRKTHARRLERLGAEGFGADDLARIHAPIGLDIGAVSPAEIAVAILGEVIAALRRKPLRSETERIA